MQNWERWKLAGEHGYQGSQMETPSSSTCQTQSCHLKSRHRPTLGWKGYKLFTNKQFFWQFKCSLQSILGVSVSAWRDFETLGPWASYLCYIWAWATDWKRQNVNKWRIGLASPCGHFASLCHHLTDFLTRNEGPVDQGPTDLSDTVPARAIQSSTHVFLLCGCLKISI